MKKLSCRLICLILCLCSLLVPSQALEATDARELLEQYYVDDLPASVYQAQTLSEVLSALNDPYTVYLTAQEYQSFLTAIDDTRIVGIGVSIQAHAKGIQILSILNNSPAQDAGLSAGDIITAVDGVDVFTTEDATARITGPEGTSIRLSILRTDGSRQEYELVRRTVVIPTTVQYALSEDGHAGVILCNSFGDGTSSHFMEAILTYDDSVNAWIIDLTANPGGTDVSAASSAGWFIGSAPMVFYRDGLGNYSYVYTIPYTPVLSTNPAIILTSSYSASGAELFSAAMRDYGAGIAVGERTFGKGVAQTILDAESFPDLFTDDALKVTIYRFFSPNGTTSDQVGLLPTLQVSLDNSYPVSLLLCADEPELPDNHLKVTLAGWDFFINLDTALCTEYLAPFTELLEALLPSTHLWLGENDQWQPTSPGEVAQKYRLKNYRPRTFSDLDSCPQSDAIHTLASYKLISGFGDGTFHPQDTLTRAELCAMLANLLNLDLLPVTESSFYDVSPDFWYASAVHAICQRGFLPGFSDGAFHPDSNMTQQDLVDVLADLAARLNMNAFNLTQTSPSDEELAPYTNFSSWARKSAWVLGSLGLDLSHIEPTASVSRGIAADLFCQLLRQTGLLWQ